MYHSTSQSSNQDQVNQGASPQLRSPSQPGGWIPPPLPPPRFVENNPLAFDWERKRLQEAANHGRGEGHPLLQTGTAPSVRAGSLSSQSGYSTSNPNTVNWSKGLSTSHSSQSTGDSSSSTVKAISQPDQNGVVQLSASASSSGSLPSFAALTAEDPFTRRVPPESRPNAYDQSLLSRLSQRSEPLARSLGSSASAGTSPAMTGPNDPSSPKSFDNLNQASHAVPRFPDNHHIMPMGANGIMSPHPSGPGSHGMHPAYAYPQYAMDTRYYPYGVPRQDYRPLEPIHPGSTEYGHVGPPDPMSQHMGLRGATPDMRIDPSKTGQKRRANSPPPASMPPNSAGVPFRRAQDLNGQQLPYHASPIHPHLEQYTPNSYQAPPWIAGPGMPPAMHGYGPPEVSQLNGSPYAGMPPSHSSTGVSGQQQQQQAVHGVHTPARPSNQSSQPSTGQGQTFGASATPRLDGAFMCECCPKKPKKFETLEQLRTHEGEKQYACLYCNNRFKNKNEAERHQNSLHLRPHSWSCAALHGVEAAFHATAPTLNRNVDNTSTALFGAVAGSQATPTTNTGSTSPGAQSEPGSSTSGAPTKSLQNLQVSDTDSCGYCGQEFSNDPEPDWAQRVEHLTQVHKYGECNQNKKFFRADHFRQHLKHSHAGTSGKWTNMLEGACMRDEQPPVPLARNGSVTAASSGSAQGMNSPIRVVGGNAAGQQQTLAPMQSMAAGVKSEGGKNGAQQPPQGPDGTAITVQ